MRKVSKKKPFLVMGEHPSDLTRTAFRRMSRANKREVMIEWFGANYEDPANRLPYESAEGGYQWIWGGPYDAEEELREQFEGLAPESLIDEVAEHVQAEGLYEWAPTPRRDDYDDSDRRDEPEFDPIDDAPDTLGPLFGSAEEIAARQAAIEALQHLENLSREPRSPSIGHNQPPSAIDEEETKQVEKIGQAAKELREELEKTTPEAGVAKRLIRTLGRGLAASAKWIGKKADVAADEIIKNTVRVAFLSPFLATETNIQAAAKAAYQFAVRWLHLATSPL